jgi:hypothetical protein
VYWYQADVNFDLDIPKTGVTAGKLLKRISAGYI